LGDHEVVRVGKKVFLWLSAEDGGCFFGVRLPSSIDAALTLPGIEPMAYGMAKWGWINATFKKGEAVPVELIGKWLDESFRTVAPKKLVKQLDGPEPAAAKKPSNVRRAQRKA